METSSQLHLKVLTFLKMHKKNVLPTVYIVSEHMAAPPELLLQASHSGGNMCAFCACGEWDTLSHQGALGPHTHTLRRRSSPCQSSWLRSELVKNKTKATHPTVRARPDFQGREARNAVWQPWSSAYPCKAVTARTCCSFLAVGCCRCCGHEAQLRNRADGVNASFFIYCF